MLTRKYGYYIRHNREKQFPLVLEICVPEYEKWEKKYHCFVTAKKVRQDVQRELGYTDMMMVIVRGQQIDDDEYLVDCGCIPSEVTSVAVIPLPGNPRAW